MKSEVPHNFAHVYALVSCTILGVLSGEFYSLDLQVFSLARYTAICLCMAGFLFPRVKWHCWSLAIFIWTFAHSPPSWTQGLSRHGKIAVANGCGLIDDDVLVESDGRIWRAKGAGQKGDDVERINTSPLFSRDARYLVTAPSLDSSLFCVLSGNLRSTLMRRFDDWPTGRKEWLQAFVLGAKMNLDGLTENALRRLGLLHVVVLSGGHLAVLSSFALISVRLVPLVFFSTRLITMRTWPWIWMVTGVISTSIVFLFSMAVGFSQSIQRAFLMFLAGQLGGMLFKNQSKWHSLLWIWVVQCVLFPVHILSLSMLLTWLGSLTLSAHVTSHFRKSFYYIIKESTFIQCLFFVASFLIFGSGSLLSILVNLTLVPIFSVFLVANIFLFYKGPTCNLSQWIVESQMTLLFRLRELAALQSQFPSLTWYLPPAIHSNDVFRGSLIFIYGLYILSKVYQRSVTRHE